MPFSFRLSSLRHFGRCALLTALLAGHIFGGVIYVTNELPNSNSSVSSVSAYGLTTQTFLGNLVPTVAYDLPDAITVDSAGNVYVADASANRVVEFNSAGTQVATSPRTREAP